MKTAIPNKKVIESVDEKEEPNWPVIIPILVVMAGLMLAFYFIY
jgi:hypothetical protein